MTAPHQNWQILPHGKLTPLEDNILTVVGQIKMLAGELPRRMTAVRRRHGGLVIFSAIALDENEVKTLNKFKVPMKEQDELLAILGSLKPEIVTK